MGRQHTTWISDETWDRLGNIAGDSVSKKISNAVKFADPDEMMRHNAQMRQLAAAKKALRDIANINNMTYVSFPELVDILDDCDWLWGADIRE